MMDMIKGGVTSAKGFKAACSAAGIKYKGRTDMAMVVSEVPAVCAGTFTSNVVKAACVKWDMDIVKSGKKMSAVVVNSGIANACTGEEGYDACRKTAKAVKEALGIDEDTVAVASTGVIGMQLPVDKLVDGVKDMAAKLSDSEEAGTDASKAIMTTDTVNKERAVSFSLNGKTVTLGGMSKGSGMIHPNMGTMLGYMMSDVAIDYDIALKTLREVIEVTFNMVSVDGDTSTNDTLLIMANGMAGNPEIKEGTPEYEIFKEAIHYVNETQAKRLAGDGEGAKALVECHVIGAATKADARTLAKSVICSSLTKAAIFGHDANWGRILCALGYSGAKFDPEDMELYYEADGKKMLIYKDGSDAGYSE